MTLRIIVYPRELLNLAIGSVTSMSLWLVTAGHEAMNDRNCCAKQRCYLQIAAFYRCLWCRVGIVGRMEDAIGWPGWMSRDLNASKRMVTANTIQLGNRDIIWYLHYWKEFSPLCFNSTLQNVSHIKMALIIAKLHNHSSPIWMSLSFEDSLQKTPSRL
jgi:hypothetical protein